MYISARNHARKLIFSSTVHLTWITKINNCHTWVILPKVGEVHIFKHRLCISALEQARALILGKYVLLGVINTFFGTRYEVTIKQLYSSSIHK